MKDLLLLSSSLAYTNNEFTASYLPFEECGSARIVLRILQFYDATGFELIIQAT